MDLCLNICQNRREEEQLTVMKFRLDWETGTAALDFGPLFSREKTEAKVCMAEAVHQINTDRMMMSTCQIVALSKWRWMLRVSYRMDTRQNPEQKPAQLTVLKRYLGIMSWEL